MKFDSLHWPPRIRLAALLLQAIFIPILIQAQWSADPTTNTPVCTATADQLSPAIASDGSGGAIIAWYDYRAGGTDPNVYAQRVNSAGTTLWTTDGVLVCSASSFQLNVRILSDGSGGAFIAWQDSRDGQYDLYAQRISSSGIRQWAAGGDSNGVAVSKASGSQDNPTIISDGAGGVIIAWQDLRGGTYDIYAQRLNGSGVRQWIVSGDSNGVAVSTASAGQVFPKIVEDGSGGAIIGWDDARNGSDIDIYAQRINGSGARLWIAGSDSNGFAFSAATGNQTSSSLVGDGFGGAIAAWNDTRSGTSDIYAQRVNASGTAKWQANGVPISTASGAQSGGAILSNNAGGGIIVWSDFGGGSYEIYAQRFDSLGIRQWAGSGDSNGVNISNGGLYYDLAPKVLSDGSEGAIVVWSGYGEPYENSSVYAQQISSSGTTDWSSGAIAVGTAAHDQLGHSAIGDGAGGAIITWHDKRDSVQTDIYATRLSSGGTLPVQLSRFTAQEGPQSIELRWSTETEVNNYGFEIQRRVISGYGSLVSGSQFETENPERETQWSRIGFVKGSGTSSSQQEYAFVDRNVPPGRYAFRIKQIDNSGRFQYVGSVEVEVGLVLRELRLDQNYPNPFNPTTTITFTVPEDGRSMLVLHDILGRRVATIFDDVAKAGRLNAAVFDGTTLSSGTYFLRLQFGHQILTKSITLLK